MLLQMALFHSFLWLIFHYLYTTSSLFIHLLTDTNVAFMSWPLKIMLLWTLGCMYLFELQFFSFTDIWPGVRLLDHMVILFFFYFYLFIFGCTGSSLLWAGFSPVVLSQGYSLAAVHRPPVVGLLLLQSTGFKVSFSSCGAQVQLSHGMVDLPGKLEGPGRSKPEIEPMSPPLAGGFFSTVPPGNSPSSLKPSFFVSPAARPVLH